MPLTFCLDFLPVTLNNPITNPITRTPSLPLDTRRYHPQ